MLGEASTVELCDALGYPVGTIEQGLDELEALFLVAAPALASISRFRIPDNTRRLVLAHSDSLISDKARLEKEISSFRKKNNGMPTKDKRVAAAISQAATFVRVGDVKTALSTIIEARKRTKNHFDLLGYQAMLHLKENPKQLDSARKLARDAFNSGCRRNDVFECWFEAEWEVANYVGALEAADAALENKAAGASDWAVRKSAALASKAHDQAKSGSLNSAVRTMLESSSTLREISGSLHGGGAADWECQQAQLHDQIWLWVGVEEGGLVRTRAQLQALQEFWKLGDYRISNLRRILSSIENMVNTLNRNTDSISRSQKNLSGQLLREAEDLFGIRHHKFPSDTRHQSIAEKWKIIRHKVDIAIES